VKTLVIGDIHGCWRELNLLLDKAGLARRDEIVAVGDLVDRGPKSWEVIQFFRDTPNARTVMGNHERKHVRWALGLTQPTQSQVITRSFCSEHYIEMLSYFAGLPAYLALKHATVLHGCLEPGVKLAEQLESVLTGSTGGERYMLRQYGQPWHRLWRGRKPVIVGHRDFLQNGQPFVYRDTIFGIDTGCYRGGWLTGLLLPEFKFIRVKARTNYWLTTLARWNRT
jgi:serine/threonine protein phosphatase 1